jgi:hypothetical protein
MIWPAMLFNLCVGLLLAGYLLRSVRRFERRVDALMAELDARHAAHMARLDRWREEELRKFDIARDEIRKSMREQIDAAIAELEESIGQPAEHTHNGVPGARPASGILTDAK